MPSHADALAAARTLAAQSGGWFWLDGSAAPEGESRVSYLGRASEILVAEPGCEREFLETLRSASDGHSASANKPAQPGSSQPGGSQPAPGGQRFHSGWVVALGYEFGVSMLGLTPAEDTAPPAFALRVGEVLAIHHQTHESDVVFAGSVAPTAFAAPTFTAPNWRSDNGSYRRQVEECRETIHRGDAYVLCLTDTAETSVAGSLNPLDLYEALSRGNSARAAMRGGVISMPGRALVSGSPERFLSVKGGTVTTHPIKGTRRRGVSPKEDGMLANELLNDPKERAENLMIVDLMRNDLSRVCTPGSVCVDRFLDVETHPHVHQLVSTVSGKLAGSFDVFDAIEACFPGGSMTGAPKRSAITTLAGLEAGSRGLYSGCFGWIDDSGEAELAMTIRGLELRADPHGSVTRVLVGAGGGITADSTPERELAERDLKAVGMLAALACASR